jgi:hypothetical protein
MSPNGKSYTEVLLEVYDKMDVVEQRIVKRLDIVVSDNADFKAGLAKGEARFDAMDKSCVIINKRIDTNATDIKKVGSLNAIVAVIGSTIAGILGTRQ